MWTDGPFPRSFWQRYLEVFDGVRVVARVEPVTSARPTWQRVDLEGLDFTRVPYYVGPQQYLRKWRAVRRAVRGAVGAADAVILRVSSQLSSILFPVLRRTRHPYAVEVVADPYDVFAPGAVRHPLRPLFRRWFSRNLRLHCREAFAAAYVTAHALQRRYPPGAGAHAIHCSDVELPPAAIAERPRQASAANGRPRTLVMVGTLAQLYKAPDVLVDAVARCVQGDLNLRLAFVGDGKHRQELEARAAAQGLNGRVDFLGQLAAGEAVRAVLDRADLFVLPSRQEGLPRALVEAMARGLPCIGSTVGGIPELLPPEDLVPPNDVEALAGKIREVVSDPQRMANTSARNLEMARQYRQEVLDKRRSDFYRYVKNKTAEWLDINRTPVAGVVPYSARSQPKMRICP